MNTIYNGIINDGTNYTVRKLALNDLDNILQLQRIVAETLTNKETLQTLSEQEYQYILNGKGLLLGAFIEEKLIAFRALMVPPIDEEHLGLAIGLEKELDKIIYQEISMVNPKYRGNRLQQQLGQLIMETLNKSSVSFKYVCCTVAPSNIPSLKDKFNQGMTVGALIEIYSGKLRYVFVKKITDSEKPQWNKTKKVPTDQIEEQQKLLQDGWHGYKLEQNNNQYFVLYGKL
ncbi:GNAT family N-acetyltransferase [Pseudogracilibacillus sp. SO30301A]|uniref:GNAT family N-acetyltransferase n=1 Tax=Pseudogracilibacillus sp. SO30301A TaxID=3098291 RepID=UPI003FA749FA